MKLYAVIPSIDRRETLTELVTVLVHDGVHVLVIDTGYEPELNFGAAFQSKTTILKDHAEPKNISRWWNLGIDLAADMAREKDWNLPQPEYVVAVLNDDVVASPGLVPGLADAIIRHNVAAAFPDVWGVGRDVVMHRPSGLRMSGYAFALRGSLRLRADERLAWWYGDNMLEWEALRAGGIVTVGGLQIQHLHPSSTTIGALAEQAARDSQTFVNIWGAHP